MLFRCPGAGAEDDGSVRVSSYIDAAETGTDVHYGLERYPAGDAPDHVVSEFTEETRILYYTGAKMWRDHIAGWMPESESEVALANDYLSGHIDRLWISPDGRRAIVLDWKTGRKDSDYRHQGFGYARLVFDAHPKVETVEIYFAWVRTKEIQPYTVSRERSDAWMESYKAGVLEWDGEYHPGDHCTNCPRQSACPALRQVAQQSVAIFQSGSLDLASMAGPDLVGFYHQIKTMVKLVGIADEAMKREVDARGSVDDGEGGVLHYVEEEGPRKVDTLAAWPVLKASLTDEEIAGCVKVGLGAIDKALMAKSPRGKGAAAKRAMAEALETAKAVSSEPIKKLRHDRRRTE